MKQEQIDSLLKLGGFPDQCSDPVLIETHISWVILCEKYVFKIKKPVHFTFLDFSTLEKRNYYCKREVILNRRLVEGIYIGVLPIIKKGSRFIISSSLEGKIIDYAVMMHRMDADLRMDKLLNKRAVTKDHMEAIAGVLLKFHNHAHIAYSLNPFNIQHTFNDILAQQPYLKKAIGKGVADKIENAVKISDNFIQYHLLTFKRRSDLKFVRDVHGDLHSKNIFLTDPPTIFDCIEFNDEIRQVDILNELAFLCMDLEAMDHLDLSTYFMNYYNSKFKVILTKEDTDVFIYYKANRANIRAKVNALRARDSTGRDQKKALSQCKKYIELMDGYLEKLVSQF